MTEKVGTYRGIEKLIGLGLGVLGLETARMCYKEQLLSPGVSPPENLLLYTYLNHTGDLSNCFGAAVVLDMGLNKIVDLAYNHFVNRLNHDGRMFKILERIYFNRKYVNYISVALSSLMVSVEETVGIMSSPDIKDIPAGIIGALVFGIPRHLMLSRAQHEIKDYNTLINLPDPYEKAPLITKS